jgi:GNAT superfamily N-acetyltransferase
MNTTTKYHQNLYQIRPANTSDPIYMKNCDLKCFDEPWDNETWEKMATTAATTVATFRGTPVGFAVYVSPRNRLDTVHLIKLCVTPQHRGRGVGALLFEHVTGFARIVGAKTIEIMIPEYLCDPRQPFSCIDWLKVMGFRADVPIVPDLFTYAGQPEAGIHFTCEVNNETQT